LGRQKKVKKGTEKRISSTASFGASHGSEPRNENKTLLEKIPGGKAKGKEERADKQRGTVIIMMGLATADNI